MYENIHCLILAAGDGTRMKSDVPKVLHKLCGKPMISILVDTLKRVGVDNIIAVVGYKEELIKSELGSKVNYVTQKDFLGTAHAVLQAKDLLSKKKGKLVILCGDAVLAQAETLKKFFDKINDYDAQVITMELDNPFGYGRIVKDNAGNVLKIVEQSDASEQELLIKEVNSGMYSFNIKDIFEVLDKVSSDNKQKEYYLTDVIEILNKQDKKINTFFLEDPREAIGINSRADLVSAEKFLKEKITTRIMDNAVTIIDPDLIYIEADVSVGKETVIEPFVKIGRGAMIGEACRIKSFTNIEPGQIVGNSEEI